MGLRPRQLALAGAAALLPLALGGQAFAAGGANPLLQHTRRAGPSVLSPADIQRLSANATNRSIIILKDQHANLPARGPSAHQRTQVVDADQSAIKSELSQLHAPSVKSFHLVNAVAATVSDAEVQRLTANPAVQAVVPDLQRRFADQFQGGGGGNGGGSGPPGPPTNAICPSDPAQPLLEPEALGVMNVEFQSKGQPAAHDLADGTGVKVALIADGLDPNNPDLMRNGKSIVFDFQDFSGFGNAARTDGREAFLDAGAIAAQGNQVYDLSSFVNPAHPLPPGCTIRIRGVAPGASIAALNVSGPAPGFFNSQIIQAIEWAVNVDQVDVLNQSFGGLPIPDTRNDPVQLADEAAVAAGVTVVTSSGDAGPTNTIGSPATSSSGTITAGGSTTFQVYRQTTRYGTQLVPGGWLDNNITALSSAGTSEFGARTVDVVAPGDRGWELCSTDVAHFFGCRDIDNGQPQPIWAAGGTSLSAPLTSGTAALVIQAYEKTHNGVRPSPALVKQIIVSSATDLGAPADHQGAGLVNSLKAVQLAESVKDANGGTPLGQSLLVSKNDLTATSPVGAAHTFQVSVTDTGTAAQTVSPTVVGLGAGSVSDDTGTVAISDASPQFVDGEGNIDSYAIHQFSVPQNVDYLNGDIVWNQQAQPNGSAFETVFDPLGRVAGYSLLGTDHSGHGHVEVRQPTAGTWTAVIFTINIPSRKYRGDVQFEYFTQRFQPTGVVSPRALTLAPGQSGSFSVRVQRSSGAGDVAYSLRLANGAGTTGSVPIVIRSLIPVSIIGGTFNGILTGGGSVGNAGQRLSFQFDVPAGRPALNLGVQLRDPNYSVEGVLTDPSGEPQDVQSTAQFDANLNFLGFSPALQFFHRSPAPGRWTVSLLVNNGIDGSHLAEPFSGSINFQAPQVTAMGLPNSPATVLPAGKPVTATIAVTNTGNSGKQFFADPRLEGKSTLPLVGSDVNQVPLPLSLFAQPNWLVPTNTTSLEVAAQGTVPIVMDISAANGDPDRLGVSLPGGASVATLTAPEVAPGFFFALPEAAGPFPPTGVGTATVNLAALAMTNPFDTAVTPDSGDLWLESINPSAPLAPLTLAPGQTGTITLTITPSAPKGTVVHGFVAVDAFNFFSFGGDELINVPYTYQVG